MRNTMLRNIIAIAVFIVIHGCCTTPFEEIQFTDQDGLLSTQQKTNYINLLRSVSTWIEIEGICVSEIEFVPELEIRGELYCGWFQPGKIRIDTGGYCLREETILHEICHGIDWMMDDISTQYEDIFPDYNVSKDLYRSHADRTAEAFADYCEIGPERLSLALIAEQACPRRNYDKLHKMLMEQIFPNWEPDVVGLSGTTNKIDPEEYPPLSLDEGNIIDVQGTSKGTIIGLIRDWEAHLIIEWDPRTGEQLRSQRLQAWELSPDEPPPEARLLKNGHHPHIIFWDEGLYFSIYRFDLEELTVEESPLLVSRNDLPVDTDRYQFGGPDGVYGTAEPFGSQNGQYWWIPFNMTNSETHRYDSMWRVNLETGYLSSIQTRPFDFTISGEWSSQILLAEKRRGGFTPTMTLDIRTGTIPDDLRLQEAQPIPMMLDGIMLPNRSLLGIYHDRLREPFASITISHPSTGQWEMIMGSCGESELTFHNHHNAHLAQTSDAVWWLHDDKSLKLPVLR